MPLEIRGPFNSITIALPWEQAPLVIPIAGGGTITLSLFKIAPDVDGVWLLAGGVWSDTGVWNDAENWSDAA